MSSPYPQRLTGFARRFLICRQSGHSSVVGVAVTLRPRASHAPTPRRPVRGIFGGLYGWLFAGIVRASRFAASLGCRTMLCTSLRAGPGHVRPWCRSWLSGSPSALASRGSRWRPGLCHFQNRLPFCPGTEKTPARASVFSLLRDKKTSVTVITDGFFFLAPHQQPGGTNGHPQPGMPIAKYAGTVLRYHWMRGHRVR